MSNQKKVFDPNVNYADRFVKKFGKRVTLPEFKNLDVQFHPFYRDHIVVLSKVEMPNNYKITQIFDGNMNSMSDIAKNYPDEYEAALVKAEAKQAQRKLVNTDRETNGKPLTFQ